MEVDKKSRTGAFFDVDKTVVNLNTMSSFHWYYYRHRHAPVAAKFFRHAAKAGDMVTAVFKSLVYLLHALKKDDRQSVNKAYFAGLRGIEVEEYQQLAAQWARAKLVESAFNDAIVKRLREHQGQNHVVAFVSGSHTPLIKPIAMALGVKFVVATEVETAGDYYTGKLTREEPLVGTGKAGAMRTFAEKNDIDLSLSYAYADHISDAKMLYAVGHPFAVIGDKRLLYHARGRAWTVIKL